MNPCDMRTKSYGAGTPCEDVRRQKSSLLSSLCSYDRRISGCLKLPLRGPTGGVKEILRGPFHRTKGTARDTARSWKERG